MRIRILVILCALACAGALGWYLFFFETEKDTFNRLKKTDPHLCMSLNVYWEAGGIARPPEPDLGLYMVAWVTLRRAKVGRRGGWPSDVCRVVWQARKNGKRITPEFSWTITSAKDRIPSAGPRWELSKKVAREVLNGSWKPPEDLERALSYKRTDNKGVRPRNRKWFNGQIELRAVGSHTFYGHDF
jgi:hypothetical protein